MPRLFLNCYIRCYVRCYVRGRVGYQFPYTAGAGPFAESASNTFGFIHHVFKAGVFLLSADGPSGRQTHRYRNPCSFRRTRSPWPHSSRFVGVLPGVVIVQADTPGYRSWGQGRPYPGLAVEKLINDRGCPPACTDGVGDQARTCSIPDGKTFSSEVWPVSSTLANPLSSATPSPRKVRSGTSPMDSTTVLAGSSSPSLSLTPLAVISLVNNGQRNRAPHFSASSFSLRMPQVSAHQSW